MRIAVIGMGKMGLSLGRQWADAGHQVTFCVRNPGDPDQRSEAGEVGASIGPVRLAAEADAVLLAVPWRGVPDALRSAGNLAGKVLLDCTVPANPELTELILDPTTSGGEEIARLISGAHVVKIFACDSATHTGALNSKLSKVSMLYACDDASASQTAAKLAQDIGFEPVYVGPLRQARVLEPLIMARILLLHQQEMLHAACITDEDSLVMAAGKRRSMEAPMHSAAWSGQRTGLVSGSLAALLPV